MTNQPFFRPPFYPNYYHRFYTEGHEKTSSTHAPVQDEKKSSRFYSFGPVHFKNPIFSNLEEPIFEMFRYQFISR